MKEELKNNPCLNREFCENCSKGILRWTIAGNLFLAIVKFAGGILTQSAGLLADGMQSVSIIISNVIIIYSLNIAKRKRDLKFPYGYGKLEFIIALAIFSILFGLGMFITLSSLILIIQRNPTVPGIMGLPAAAISIFAAYMMYRYNVCAGKNLDSPAMLANGYNSRADMFSSVAAAIGIVLSQLSPALVFLDRLAALIIGLLIIKDAVEHWLLNLRVILDKIPELQYKEKIKSLVKEIIPDFQLQVIKLKRTGRNFWIGIGVDFPETFSIKEMEDKTDKIKDLLKKKVSWLEEVDIFV